MALRTRTQTDSNTRVITRSQGQNKKNVTKQIMSSSENLRSCNKDIIMPKHSKNGLSSKDILYTSIDGAVGGIELNLSSDSFLSCSEEISDSQKHKENENKKNQKEIGKSNKPKGRPRKRNKSPQNNVDNIPNINSQNGLVLDIEIDTNKHTLDDLWSIIKALRNSVVFISQQYDSLLKQNEELQKNHEKVLKDNQSLKASQNKQFDDMVLLRKEVERVSLVVNASEQEKLESSMVLKNLPELNSFQSKEVMVNIATMLSVNLRSQDIYTVQKLPLKANEKFDYVYQLNNRDTKNSIINNCKNNNMVLKKDLSIKSVDNFHTTSDPRIFLTNHMTPYNHTLLKKAKSLHNFGFRYVWFKYGKVFARESNNANCNTIRISSLDLVDKLILQRSKTILTIT